MNRSKYRIKPGIFIKEEAHRIVKNIKGYVKNMTKDGRKASSILRSLRKAPDYSKLLSPAVTNELGFLCNSRSASDAEVEAMSKAISVAYDKAKKEINELCVSLVPAALEAGKKAVVASVHGDKEPDFWLVDKAYNLALGAKMPEGGGFAEAADTLELFQGMLELMVTAGNEAVRRHCERVVTGKF